MNKLSVHLGDFKVGELTDAEPPVFAYDPAWLQSAHPSPLSRQLPLQAGPFSGRPVRAFFAGLLPEADPRERIASIFGVSPGNDFALLERLGGECAGAVSLRPADHPSSTAEPSLLAIDPARLADIVGQLPQRPLLAGTEGVRLSLAGAQVKLPVVVDQEDGSLALPLGGAASTHILKPEPARFPGLAANEAFCMALARAAGLEAVETQWLLIGATPCLLVRRYDRELSAEGRWTRVHQEDFCQALGVPPERKYQAEGGPSLPDCFELLREWSTAPVLDIRSFLDALIFAVLTGNADAHAKNFSWLYRGRVRRMAPLYDQVCTLAWPELSGAMSMKIGAAKLLRETSPEHFRQLAARCGLGWPMVRGRLAELAATVERIAHKGVVDLPEPARKDAEPVRQDVLSLAARMQRLLR